MSLFLRHLQYIPGTYDLSSRVLLSCNWQGLYLCVSMILGIFTKINFLRIKVVLQYLDDFVLWLQWFHCVSVCRGQRSLWQRPPSLAWGEHAASWTPEGSVRMKLTAEKCGISLSRLRNLWGWYSRRETGIYPSRLGRGADVASGITRLFLSDGLSKLICRTVLPAPWSVSVTCVLLIMALMGEFLSTFVSAGIIFLPALPEALVLSR